MTSIFSRTDGVVRWLSCVADYATCVEVPGSHLGMMRKPPRLPSGGTRSG